jgi:hypothetical protein
MKRRADAQVVFLCDFYFQVETLTHGYLAGATCSLATERSASELLRLVQEQSDCKFLHLHHAFHHAVFHWIAMVPVYLM